MQASGTTLEVMKGERPVDALARGLRKNLKGVDNFLKYMKAYKGCRKIRIPEDACHITFTEGKPYKKAMLEAHTMREETILLELTEDNRIIGMELLGDNKPCQGIHKL